MSTIIRTRSPYFIRTPQESDSNLSYFQAVITVHGGVSGSTEICDDLYATYTFKKKPLPNETSVTFEISELVNDHLIQTYNGTLSNSALTQSIWVDVVTSARESDGTLIGSTTSTSYLAQEGFNKFKEGVNYTTEQKYMLSTDYYEYNVGSYIRIPVNLELVTIVEFMDTEDTVRSTLNFTDNGNQNQKIAYAEFNTASLAYTIAKARITHSAGPRLSLELSPIEECKFGVHTITFLNRWGALQDLFFFKKSVETLDTRNETFNRSIFKPRTVELEPPEEIGQDCQETITFNTYSTTAHSKKVHNANGTESILLNTGFVDERMNVYFEELMVSEYIWLTDDENVIYPITLKDSNFTYKTGLNDRLINYTMNFEKAFNFVNDIR